MLTVVVPAHAQSGAAPPPSRSGQPGRSVQSGQPGQPGSPGARGGQPRGPELWWRERSPFSKELGLTKDQTDRIEKLFQATRPELNKLDHDLKGREDTLSDMIKDDFARAVIAQQIDVVEATRSRMNKTRALMLFDMRQVLTPPQRAKFPTLHEQWQQELQKTQLEREKQDREHKQNPNQKPDPRSAPDRQGRPGA